MDRLRSGVLAGVAAIALAAGARAAEPVPPAAAGSPTGTLSAHRISAPVVVDGVLDEACWRDATPVPVVFRHDAQGQRADRPEMIARFAWDSHCLYIGYEVFDTNLVSVASGEDDGPASNRRPGAVDFRPGSGLDLVEFFVTFGDSNFFWEVHQSPGNQFNDVFCVAPNRDWPLARSSATSPLRVLMLRREYLPDDGTHTVARAVRLNPKADGTPSTVNAPGDVDTGFTGELRLPWTGFGPPMRCRKGSGDWYPTEQVWTGVDWALQGETIGLLAVYLNGDNGGTYYHSGPDMPRVRMFHMTAASWPRVTLR